jgi:hypothetical protein
MRQSLGGESFCRPLARAWFKRGAFPQTASRATVFRPLRELGLPCRHKTHFWQLRAEMGNQGGLRRPPETNRELRTSFAAGLSTGATYAIIMVCHVCLPGTVSRTYQWFKANRVKSVGRLAADAIHYFRDCTNTAPTSRGASTPRAALARASRSGLKTGNESGRFRHVPEVE